PALIAGLPGNNRCVFVGPPLSASEPSLASATPIRFPFVPFVIPPEPPVPIRLFALFAASTATPWRSSATVVADPRKLPATIVLRRVIALPPSLIPPPVPAAL